mgnify:CR=1 FL=1
MVSGEYSKPRRTLLVPGRVSPAMSLLSRLFLLFVGVPLLELLLLIQVGGWIGLWPTIGLVVATGVGGAALARLEGIRTLLRIQGELEKGVLPGNALLDGLAVLLGGAFLLTPGILTDLVGFSFLIPATRGFLKTRIKKSLEKRLETGSIRIMHFGGFTPRESDYESPGQGREGTGGATPGEIVVEPEDSPLS